MQPLANSVFLQPLGHALLSSLWQMAAIWLLTMAVCFIFRLTAAQRHRLLVIGQLAGFAWFVATFITGFGNDHSNETTTLLASSSGYSFLKICMQWLEGSMPYLSLVYLPVATVLIARWIFRYRRTQSIRTEGLQKIPAQWRVFIAKTAAHIGIKKEVTIFLSDKIFTPLTIGFLKPVILIPVASINHLSTTQLEAVLLHELAHIQRNDYLLNILLTLNELILFFNPFTRLLARSIERERENSCDDMVIRFQYDTTDYAAALLRIAYLQATPAFAMTAATGKKKELLGRIQRFTGASTTQSSYRKQVPVIWMMACGLIFSGWLLTTKGKQIVSPEQYRQASQLFVKHTIEAAPKLLPAKYIEPSSPVENKIAAPITRQKVALITVKHIHTAPAVTTVAVMPSPVDQPTTIMAATKEEVQVENILLPVSAKADASLASLKNIDLDRMILRALQTVQLTEEEKKEFMSFRELVSDKDLQLIRKAFSDYQPHSTTPLVINISFSSAATDDNEAKQIVKIKMAVLQKLTTVMQNRARKENAEGVIVREQ